MTRGSILIIDDEPAMVDLLTEALGRRGFGCRGCTTPDDARAILGDASPLDALVTDLNMRGVSGLELCRFALDKRPGLPVIVITAFGSSEAAVEAVRAGAYDFVTKPLEMDRLVLALDRAVQLRRLNLRLAELSHATGDGNAELLLGHSPAMASAREMLVRIAGSDVTVLLLGETGTGKELAARTIHQHSSRRDEPFVAINCAAVPEQLIESELFGHAKGAFTDARQARRGLLSEAGDGVLFLDEVGELPLAMQAKFLRVLQDRRYRPVGADQELEFKARVIAATNRDLEDATRQGTFRADLLYRLDVISVELPPLRVRGSDILLLAQRFLARAAERMGKPAKGLTHGAVEKLLAYSWPGNVRELENCMERAMAVSELGQVVETDFPKKLLRYKPDELPPIIDAEDLVPLAEIERRYIRKVLAASGNNKSVAARILGIDRKTLFRKLDLPTSAGTSGQASAGSDEPGDPRAVK